ncbi:cytochrome P450 [Lasiosphaeris hirsuta]|uniref:Cytochrome P450 n=1 Tax=Lasiosphaeris hirsuta TaxID=260670 RepID=A0AA39ZRL3_9PEZI|nr:cytochrome P450 [Lasiosphaeris hirsuta]
MFGISNLSLLGSIVIARLSYVIFRLVTIRRFYKDLPKSPHSFLWGHLKLMEEISALYPPNTHPQYFLPRFPRAPAQMIITGAEAAVKVSVTKIYPIHSWAWKMLHHMMGPSFTPKAVKSQVDTIAEHVIATFEITSSIVLDFSLQAQQEGLGLLDDFMTVFAMAQPYVDAWNPVNKLWIGWTIWKAFVYMLLSLHPDTLARVRREHDDIFGPDSTSTLETLRKTPSKLSDLEYTSAALKETLRMFPIGFNPREAPPGVSALEHNPEFFTGNPEYFADPNKFLPGRFLESYEPKANRYAWRPFGRGPHACMGQELAMDEVRIMLLLTARWLDFRRGS